MNFIALIRPNDDKQHSLLWLIVRAPFTLSGKGQKLFYEGPAVYNKPGLKMTGYKSPNLLLGLWIYTWLVCIFTIPGRLLFMLTTAFFLTSMTSLLMPVYYLSLTMISLFIIDYVAGWILRPKLKIHKQCPLLAAENQIIHLSYKITNLRKIPALELFVDKIPYKNIHFPSGFNRIKSLEAGKTIHLQNTCVIDKRGEYQFPLVYVCSIFPFGLTQKGDYSKVSDTVYIYPDYKKLKSVALASLAHRQQGDEQEAKRSTDGTDFMGIREYRFGDNPRHIHALRTAQLQMPIVKEYSLSKKSTTLLYIDIAHPSRTLVDKFLSAKNIEHEACMYLLAAVADFLYYQNIQMDIYIPGLSDDVLCMHRGIPFQEILIKVASTNPVYGHELSYSIDPSNYQQAICIMMNMTPDKKDFLSTLKNKTIYSIDFEDEDSQSLGSKEILSGAITEL
ncbi:MAG: DUF58 domain-containing protein [Lentisphaeria bacterium]|nr:DUF58 domain-containing protein [Lentisphaeria bacterium]